MQQIYHHLLHQALRLYRFLFQPTTQRVRCVVLHQQEVLLVKHVGGDGDWSLPGGGPHEGELPEATAIRELKEEFDLSIKITGDIGTVTNHRRHATQIAHVLVARTTASTLKPNRFEILEAGWFRVDALPQPLSPVAAHALRKLPSAT